MMELLVEYLPVIVVSVSIIGIWGLLQTKYKKEVATTLLYLVIKAEKEFGSKTGQLKYSAVSSWVYEKLPAVARIVLSPSIINELIEDAVAKMKEYLESNAEAKELIESDSTE